MIKDTSFIRLSWPNIMLRIPLLVLVIACGVLFGHSLSIINKHQEASPEIKSGGRAELTSVKYIYHTIPFPGKPVAQEKLPEPVTEPIFSESAELPFTNNNDSSRASYLDELHRQVAAALKEGR